MRMGGMSGLELFDRLAIAGSQLPCIVLTGHGDVPMAVEALKKGVYDFVEKPFDGNALVDKLIAALAVEEERFERERSRQSGLDRLATLSQRERDVMRSVARRQTEQSDRRRPRHCHADRRGPPGPDSGKNGRQKRGGAGDAPRFARAFLSGEIFDGAIVEVVAGSDDLQMPFGN